LYGTLEVTLAMLLYLINCRFIIIIICKQYQPVVCCKHVQPPATSKCNYLTLPVTESRTQVSRPRPRTWPSRPRPRPRTSNLSSRILEDDDLSSRTPTLKHRIKCFGEAPNTLHIYSVIGNGQNSKLLTLKSFVQNMQ